MNICWAIKITYGPHDGGRTALAGCGFFSRDYEPQGTKLFFTRKATDEAIRQRREGMPRAFRGRWASQGGTRIYRYWRAVRVDVQISEVK